MPQPKRSKTAAAHDDSPADHDVDMSDDESVASSSGQSSAVEPDTDDEIADMKHQKSKKTLKRKHRATDPSKFGATLQNLLETEAPSGLPLSLNPSVARKRNDSKLESKARRIIQVEKKEEEDKGRVRDVIGGWGAENERALRKIAQRGVVKLFNVIQQAQSASTEATEELKTQRGTGKPTLPAPVLDRKAQRTKSKQKDNLLGRGKEANVDKDAFLDMIRSGGIASIA